MKTLPSFFSAAEPDEVGEILGTGYWRFETAIGISGLAKWDHAQIEILAVVAKKPGTGQFREFIGQCQKNFALVIVWEDWNPLVGEALSRYNFERVSRQEPNGEKLKGWCWTTE